MTRISEIHGLAAQVPANEFADRGKEVTTPGYIPFLSLTAGEMRLLLIKQRADLLAQFYPDVPAYRAAAQMVDGALQAGVHRGVAWVGGVSDDLQRVARAIAQAEGETWPAAGHIFGRPTIYAGIGSIIGDCEAWATEQNNRFYGQNNSTNEWKFGTLVKKARRERWNNFVAECVTRKQIEQLYNDRINALAHHMLYHQLSEGYQFPNKVETKHLLHIGGIEAMGNAADMGRTLMGTWVENGVVAKNAQLGAGPAGSVSSSFSLAEDGNAQYERYKAWQNGQPIPPNPKQGKINAIGVIPAAAVIISAIATAITAAAGFLSELTKLKQGAMAAASGFGTTAYAGAKTDWPGSELNDLGPKSSLPFLLLLGGGALLLFGDDK